VLGEAGAKTDGSVSEASVLTSIEKENMCGIAGICDLKNGSIDTRLLRSMTDRLVHRGPDDQGYVFFGKDTCQELDRTRIGTESNRFFLGFGHRRLSIIDLSAAGHQPMPNEDQTIWITYNGEIYNFPEIRKELTERGHGFRSNTDSEVVLHAYEEWGVDCLQKFIGMWAFALWDQKKSRLFCARDRLGIKPFYYHSEENRFLFASEIKAIIADQTVNRIPNDARVYTYLAYGYLDETDETFFRGIKQLPGGCYLTLDLEGWRLAVSRYWDIEPKETAPCKSDRTCDEVFLDLFTDAVRIRLRSDVPVGTCLSGGLDSSSIVCVASRLLGNSRLNTFSSCFEEEGYDERPYIEDVVKQTNVENYHVFPDPDSLGHEIERLLWHQDEPFGSTSIYAQWRVFRLAQSWRTKVILDGQGADEILGGYHPLFGDFLADLLMHGRVMRLCREIRCLRSLHAYSYKWIAAHIIAGLMRAEAAELGSRFLLSRRRVSWLLDVKKIPHLAPVNRKFGKKPLLNRLYGLLTATSLPALLHYEDRNSMAHSIEARIPFLDHRLVEFVFSLPLDQIIKDGMTKVILREAMTGILPRRVRERVDKIGFGTPEDIWYRTTMKDWIGGIIRSGSLGERGYLNPRQVAEEFDLHCSGKKNMGFTIWRWVNLELWFRRYIDQVPVSPPGNAMDW